jgi:hypothetical protein
MANFLQLCQDMARESGAIGAPPASVLNQTGRQAKCVNWVRDAWTQIQNDNPEWIFMRKSFTHALSIGSTSYSPASLGITSFQRWITDTPEYHPVTIYDPANQAGECEIPYIPYSSWRVSYDRGTHDPSKPVCWSIAPDNSLVVGPKPDIAYVLRGDYQRGPQVLAADGDVPIMPDQYHDIITYRAMMMLAGHDEAAAALNAARIRHDPILFNMERDLLPAIELGGNALG